MLPFDLDVVNGISSLLYRRYTRDLACYGLLRSCAGCSSTVVGDIILREPLFIISQRAAKRFLELHVASIQVSGGEHAHVLVNAAAAINCNPGRLAADLVQLEAVHVVAKDIGARRLESVLYIGTDTQTRRIWVKVRLVLVRIEEEDTRTGLIV